MALHRMPLRTHRVRSQRAGFTLLETLVAAGLIVVVLMGALNIITRDTQLSQQVLRTANVEQLSQEMLFKIEQELANAHGRNPTAILTVSLTPGFTSSAKVSSTLGFPDQGTLLLERGTPNEERLAYTGLLADQETFTGLTRGVQCTADLAHAVGKDVLWAGMAEPLAVAGVPPAALWDGRADILGEVRYFRGDGTGFCYRVPVDPGGGLDFIAGNDVQWGASIHEESTTEGWVTLYFQPRVTYSEAQADVDLNGDGDRNDVFDIGQIRRRAWDASDPSVAAEDVGMGPTAIVQERCNWGGDLDTDGFDDPVFFYDKERRQLQIRLFLLGQQSGQPVVSRVNTLMFLRNQFEG